MRIRCPQLFITVADLDDIDAGSLGARDQVGSAAAAGKGQYHVRLLVEHYLIALRPGRGVPFLPVGRHADKSDFLARALLVYPFGAQRSAPRAPPWMTVSEARAKNIAPIPTRNRPLGEAQAALDDLRAGRVVGRTVLTA